MKRFLLLFVICVFSSTLFAQNDEVLFEIDGKKLYKSAFMKEFLRSIGQSPDAMPTACTYEKRKTLEEYVDLYLNFNVKIHDAYKKGYDTLSSLSTELSAYRKELAAPYLIDSATLKALLSEAYERNHYAIHAAHILIMCDPSASPDDTLKAYNTAMQAYNRAMAGENFFALSKEYAEAQMSPSQLAQAKERPSNGHEGDLGFFTVFDMIYPFENACYTLQPGQISLPVRSQYGYHIINLIDRVPYYGRCTLSHIWTSARNAHAEKNIKEAYNQLSLGVDFARVAHNFSDDMATSNKGGSLGTLVLQQIPTDYVSAIGRGLKAGQYSKPFQTEFGWHIVLLEAMDTIPSFETLLPNYKQRLSNDQRNSSPQAAFVNEAKRRYNFIDYTTAYGSWQQSQNGFNFIPAVKVTKKSSYASSLDQVVAALDNRVFSNSWVFDAKKITNNVPLFAIGNKTYSATDFAIYIANTQNRIPKQDLASYAALRYAEYVDAMVLAYADSRLEIENPEFAEIINEYRHGLMIFEYNNDNIWDKAIQDTAGYAKFYNETSTLHNYDNPEDSNYFWNTRARVTVYTVVDSSIIDPAKAAKIVAKGVSKLQSSADIRRTIMTKADIKSPVPDNMVLVDVQLLEQGKQSILSSAHWKVGQYIYPYNRGYRVVVVEKIIYPELKSMVEARGYYINDYQKLLENNLIQELRSKYNVIIHQDAIDAITF